MKKWQKVLIGIGIALALIIMVVVSIAQVNKGVTTVQTGQVVKEDLTSLVTASGEIRPKSYTNVLAEGYGKITDIAVNEGDHVKKGDVLMHLESVQPGADVAAQEATVAAQEEGMKAAEANYQASVATQAQRQSDLEKAKFDWQRSQQLFKERLIAKSDYDASKAAYDSAAAAVKAAQAQVEQTSAARAQQSAMVQSGEDQLTHLKDVLRKTTYRAPISGIVTYIAVRVGENVVMGIQNSEGAFLMNISDMSVVTCEVKVDETDITNVKDGQPADVTIDALPGKTFKGHVTEVGQQAILRSTGQAATTQTTANTQEARDFKVVVTLDNPPAGLRPGLSATAKIQTAQRKNILTIPIQALAVRTQKDLDDAKAGRESSVTLAAPKPSELAAAKTDIQGVFVVQGRKADFVPVQTGITGVTDIEITSGLKEGDQIVTGSYKALRSLRPGAPIKIDNSIPKAEDTSGS
ncbi:MAG TPA: efflux RND transporter periplasmic adaptor subunit [Candidatus Acidoferrales bacterium]|nr:efflux RND transporter periplasmic adaptor subunit [Candidatus Acidoferrales bacterium]